jgi:hypothetical protein
MSSVTGRNKHPRPGEGRGRSSLQSVISIILLAILLLIAIGVLIKQSNVDMARFGIDTTTAGPSLEQTAAITQESPLDALKPDGFDKLADAETYNAGNLYEKINGKAPLYIESGFNKLSTQRFISKDDESLWLELFVFDMADVRNSFSVYSVQKRADTKNLTFAGPGPCYKTSNGIYFVHGRYYIELIGSTESTTLDEVMIKIAEKFASQTPVDDRRITELALFPEENLIQGSFKLYLANAFGFEEFTDIFACRYKTGDESITAFLSRRPDPKNAQNAAEKYYNFLIENDASVKLANNAALKNDNVKVLDFYGTTEIILSTGPFVAGVHEAENQTAAEDLAAKLLAKLSNTAKKE